MATLYKPPSRVASGAHVQSLQEYRDIYEVSITNPEVFWKKIAEEFHWEKSWDEFHYSNFDKSKGKVETRWFAGGLTNICYNALDRNIINGIGSKIAFYCEGNDAGVQSSITYNVLLQRVQRFGNFLKSLGVKKGDTVALYMPMVIELVIAMLAVVRIGAVHSIIFGGFSSEAVADRVMDCKCNVIVTG